MSFSKLFYFCACTTVSKTFYWDETGPYETTISSTSWMQSNAKLPGHITTVTPPSIELSNLKVPRTGCQGNCCVFRAALKSMVEESWPSCTSRTSVLSRLLDPSEPPSTNRVPIHGLSKGWKGKRTIYRPCFFQATGFQEMFPSPTHDFFKQMMFPFRSIWKLSSIVSALHANKLLRLIFVSGGHAYYWTEIDMYVHGLEYVYIYIYCLERMICVSDCRYN